MLLRTILVTALAGYAAAVSADALDINVSSDTVEAGYTVNFRSAEFTAGALYNRDRDDWVASAGLLAKGELGGTSTRSEAGLGGKVYGASVGSQELLAVGLGGQFRIFPGNGPFGIGAYGYYAPEILTGLDGNRFWEAGARAEFEVVQRTASLYVGYRKVRANLDNGSAANIAKGGFAGIRVSF